MRIEPGKSLQDIFIAEYPVILNGYGIFIYTVFAQYLYERAGAGDARGAGSRTYRQESKEGLLFFTESVDGFPFHVRLSRDILHRAGIAGFS